jgi:hypothetical protein
MSILKLNKKIWIEILIFGFENNNVEIKYELLDQISFLNLNKNFQNWNVNFQTRSINFENPKYYFRIEIPGSNQMILKTFNAKFSELKYRF